MTKIERRLVNLNKPLPFLHNLLLWLYREVKTTILSLISHGRQRRVNLLWWMDVGCVWQNVLLRHSIIEQNVWYLSRKLVWKLQYYMSLLLLVVHLNTTKNYIMLWKCHLRLYINSRKHVCSFQTTKTSSTASNFLFCYKRALEYYIHWNT